MKAMLLLVSVFALVVLAQVASADTLWDQSDYDVWGMGYFNSESGGPPFGSTWHTVNDVTVECGWLVESITIYFSAIDPAWGGAITQGYLHVYPKTGPLPVEDPTAAPLVAMSAVLDFDHFLLTASGLSLDLPPGEYWIGITPIAPSGPMGPEICLSCVSYFGDPSASYDAYGMPMPMWFTFNPGLDAAILIEGIVNGPSAAEAKTWGQIKALYQ